MERLIAVTDAAQGLGRAIVLLFANNGYAVSLIDPDSRAAQTTIGGLRSTGTRAKTPFWI